MPSSSNPMDWTPVPDADGRWRVNLERRLGEGGFGQVYRGYDREKEGQEIAAKKVGMKSKVDRESFEVELDMLGAVSDHESIVSLYGKEITEKYGWIFLEMATGGELFDRLIDSGSLSERAAWPYTKAIAEALRYCYNKGIVHRDLKLENVMLSAEDPHAIRLIDFGLAVRLNMQEGKVVDTILKDNAGTQAYRAPEVANKSGYSALKVDVWALGIILFSLVSGFFPVQEAKSDDWRYARLVKDQANGMGACESIFRTYKRVCPFSPDLKALIDGMLTIDVSQRLSVEAVCASAWLAKAPSAPKRDDGDGVVYRGVDADDDEMMDEFSVPDDAVPLERQKAVRHLDDQMPA